MLVKFGNQEKPRKVQVEESTATSTYAKFIAEPFERVFGHSIGNALRRTMLTALEAPGIISFRIEKVPHEFMAVEGILEDMTTIVLNVKSALLRCLPSEENNTSRETRFVTNSVSVTQQDLDKVGGAYPVTLGSLFEGSLFEVINPELVLFTVTKPMEKQIDFRVGFGRGYVPSERQHISNRLTDEIVVDTAFSPVLRVNYFVENTRVGQDTDYDRLLLEVTTDGRLTPTEALSFATQVLMRSLEAFTQLKAHELLFEQNSQDSGDDDDKLLEKLILRIDEIELSVRSTNCLANADINTIAELVCIPEKKMLDFRNFGKKSLNEIKAKLMDMGLQLGMDLTRFGITTDNVKDKIKEIAEERKLKKEKKK